MEAEQARTRSEAEHRKTAAYYNSCISHMRQLEKKLKRSINKSRFQALVFCFSRSPRACAFFRTSGKCRVWVWCQLIQSRCSVCCLRSGRDGLQWSEPRNVSAGGGVLFLQQ